MFSESKVISYWWNPLGYNYCVLFKAYLIILWQLFLSSIHVFVRPSLLLEANLWNIITTQIRKSILKQMLLIFWYYYHKCKVSYKDTYFIYIHSYQSWYQTVYKGMDVDFSSKWCLLWERIQDPCSLQIIKLGDINTALVSQIYVSWQPIITLLQISYLDLLFGGGGGVKTKHPLIYQKKKQKKKTSAMGITDITIIKSNWSLLSTHALFS